MNDKVKLLLAVLGILVGGGFTLSHLVSPSESEDFPDGGTWTKCSACQEMQVIDPEMRGKFYDENPNMVGRPMVCPKCKRGSLVDGLKCPINGCFYTQAIQSKDGTPACPICKSKLL